MRSELGAINSILLDVDRHDLACHITREPAVTSERVQLGSRRSSSPLLLSKLRPLPATPKEVREANRQFIGSALLYRVDFPGAEVMRSSGLVVAWRNTPVPISNAIFLSRPVADEFDLQRRMRVLPAYVLRKEKPPVLLLCREWVPEHLRDTADERLASAGLVATRIMTGMAANDLEPASRVVSRPEWRCVTNEAGRQDFADVNADAYGFPIEAERQALAVPQIWNGRALRGYLGYLAGRAVVAAGAMSLHGAIHIVCVATRPECQRRGLAEAAIRHALNDMRLRTGLTRTTLSATEAGRPLYQRMGYHETATFVLYTRPVGAERPPPGVSPSNGRREI